MEKVSKKIYRRCRKNKKRIESLEKKGIIKKKREIKPETQRILAVKYFVQEVLVNTQVIG
jgi:hypothetical protein